MKRRGRRDRPHCGFLLLDALAGIALLAILAMILAVSINLRQRNARHLADQRAALHTAELALANLQAGMAPTTSPADGESSVAVHPTGQRNGELEWVEVTVARDGRHASITGLAPAVRHAPPATQNASSPQTSPATQPGGAR